MFRMIVMFAASLIAIPAMADAACQDGSAISAIATMSVPGMPDEIADGIGDRTTAELEELAATFGRRVVAKALDREIAKLLIRRNEEASRIIETAGFYCPCGQVGEAEHITVYGMSRRITCTAQGTAEKIVYVLILSDRNTIVIPPEGTAPIVVHKTPPTSSESD